MMAHCPKHGLQGYGLISHDLLQGTGKWEPGQVLQVDLLFEGTVVESVLVSRQFAARHGIVSDVLDWRETFVHAAWYHELGAICHPCADERFPD